MLIAFLGSQVPHHGVLEIKQIEVMVSWCHKADSFPDYAVIPVMFYFFFFNVKPQARGLRGCWLFFEENEFPVLFFVKKSFKL